MKSKRGITLVEVTVSLAIMASILTIVLSNQSTYTDGAALANDASEIELKLRETQIYGIGVKEFSVGSSEFDASYGLSFNMGNQGSNDAYIFFGDRGSAKNGAYDSGWNCPTGGTSECIVKVALSRGNTITELCYIRDNGTESCEPSRIDVTFSRPKTEANIKFFNSSGAEMPVPNLRGARMELVSPAGKTRSVVVHKTGLISVQ